MQAPDLARIFIPVFEATGFPYLITGGVGSIIYGEPRLTNDIDIVLWLRPREAERFAEAFASGGFYLPPVEVLREEAGRVQHGHFNLVHLDTMLRADVYLAGDDPLQAWGLEQRRRLPLGTIEGWVASPEYIILRKLLFIRDGASGRHLRDIAWMLRVSEALIDLQLLEGLVCANGVERQWALARETRLDD